MCIFSINDHASLGNIFSEILFLVLGRAKQRLYSCRLVSVLRTTVHFRMCFQGWSHKATKSGSFLILVLMNFEKQFYG